MSNHNNWLRLTVSITVAFTISTIFLLLPLMGMSSGVAHADGPPVSVVISGTQTGTVNANYYFTATVSPISATTPISYLWQVTDKPPMTQTNNLSSPMMFNWNMPGTKSITVTATNISGSMTSSYIVQIQPPPVITPTTVTVTGPVSDLLNLNTYYTFTAQIAPISATQPISYNWIPAPATGQGMPNAIYSWSISGLQTVTVVAQNIGGTVTGSKVITVNSVTTPTITPTAVTINGPISGSVKTDIDFMAHISPANATMPITYTWTPTPTVGQGTEKATYRWDATGPQTVTVLAQNIAGQVTGTHTITLNPVVSLTSVAITGPASGLINTSYGFTVTISPISATMPITYYWTPMPTTGQSTPNATYSWSATGPQTITIRAENAGSVVTNQHVIILSAPVIVSPTAVTITGPMSGVVNTAYNFTAQVSPISTTTPITYLWIPNPTTGQGTANASYSWPVSGSQTITVRAENTGGIVTSSQVVVISGLAVIKPTSIMISGPLTGALNTDYQFSAAIVPTDTSKPIIYTWTPTPKAGQGTLQATYNWPSAGTQAITITAENAGGIVAGNYAVFINHQPSATIDAISPNPAQLNQVISFNGSGLDLDGGLIQAYQWRTGSQILSTISAFTMTGTTFGVGSHVIYFMVQDDEGVWSTEVSRTLSIVAGAVAGDIVVGKTVAPSSTTANSTVTYTLVLTNNGAGTTTVNLTDTLPAELSFISKSAGTLVNNTTYIHQIQLSSNTPLQDRTFVLVAKTSASATPATYYNQAEVSYLINDGTTYSQQFTKLAPLTLIQLPVLSISPATALNFAAKQNGTNPTMQSFSISNSGGGTLNWTISDDADWLTSSKSSGSDTAKIDVSINVSGLVAGSYTGKITVSSNNGSQVINVNLTVEAGIPDANRRVNIPKFNQSEIDNGSAINEMAIFWFGKIDNNNNYADTLVGYSSSELAIRVYAFDQQIWYDTNPSVANMDKWDAASIYIDTDGNGVLDENSYRFTVQMNNNGDDLAEREAVYQGTGGSWQPVSVGFKSKALWQGDSGGLNNNSINERGSRLNFYIPFTSLGLSAPASDEYWYMAVIMHDKDSETGSVKNSTWPESNFSASQPSSWGLMVFNSSAYQAPSTKNTETVTIQQGIDGVTGVVDASVGGGTLCGDNSQASGWKTDFGKWGNANYAGETSFYVQHQDNIADWPCFTKSYIKFPLNKIPAGKSIVSAKLTLYHWSGSGVNPQSSLIQVSMLSDSWQESSITWNNAPLAKENIAETWVESHFIYGDWTKTNAKSWDVTKAVADAYASNSSANMALYEPDFSQHSGKYFVSSDTQDWNKNNRPVLEVTFGDADNSQPTATPAPSTPTATPAPSTPTATPDPNITPTPSPTATPVVEANIIFDAFDRNSCDIAPTWKTITGTVHLSGIATARLQTNYWVVNPPSAKTDPVYRSQIVKDGDRFTIQLYWPGIQPTDEVVNVTAGAILLNSATGNPLMELGTTADYYWVPSATCPAPTETVQTGLNGTVTNQGGQTLANIVVDLYHYNEATNSWEFFASTTTDASGNYQFNNLPVGKYQTRYRDASGVYQETYSVETAPFDSANAISVSGQGMQEVKVSMKTPTQLPTDQITEVTGQATVGRDPTGQVHLSFGNYPGNNQLTIARTVTCSDGNTPTDVTLKIGGNKWVFSMQETVAGSNKFSVDLESWRDKIIPADYDYYAMMLNWNCSGVAQSLELGTITLIDPSGIVTDASTGLPISGATVTLYVVPGWRSRITTDATDAPSTCQSNYVRATGEAWSQTAPTNLGVIPNSTVNQISPPVASLITGTDGHYAWDVSEGCWYVTVSAKGYQSKTSSVVGIPPAVTDLDIQLVPFRWYLPVILR